MKAVVCQEERLDVVDVPEPEPGQGQVLIEVLRCGICGSDLHARHNCDELADVMVEIGYDGFMRSEQRVVFGHEFSGQVADYGSGCRKKLAVGAPVVALPLVRRGGSVHAVGLSAEAPGAYAEHVVVQESLMLAVPNGISPDRGALTEPLAIAWHAVRLGEVKKSDVAIVIGCGPIGLAVTMNGARAMGFQSFEMQFRGVALVPGEAVAGYSASSRTMMRSRVTLARMLAAAMLLHRPSPCTSAVCGTGKGRTGKPSIKA